MRVTIVALSLLALGASAHPGSLQAKEPTRKLIISGGGLAGGIEIVDSATLALSNVYSGNFLEMPGVALAPPASAPRYEISFYLLQRGSWLYNVSHRPRLQVAYVVYFAPDAVHHTAYVYLPGRGDTWSEWNHGVIIREQYEGRWSVASPAWAERINGAIARHPRVPAPRCPVSDTSAFFGRGNPIHGDVSTLTALLERNGLHVLCAYPTTFDRTLGRPAAGIVTNLGAFAVLFFPPPADAELVSITSKVVNGQVMTVLRSPDSRERPVTMVSADKTDFLTYKRWLFDTWQQPQLRAALASALRNSTAER
jgi:hypothetical protein